MWDGPAWRDVALADGVVVGEGTGTPPAAPVLPPRALAAATGRDGRTRVVVEAAEVRVEGTATPCTLPRATAPGRVSLAVGRTHAAVARGGSARVELLRLADCRIDAVLSPLADRYADGPIAPAPSPVPSPPDGLIWVEERLYGVYGAALLRWDDAHHRPRALGAHDVQDVLPGPSLLVPGALLRPDGTHLPTTRHGRVAGEGLVQLDDDGLRWIDAEGRVLGRLGPGQVSVLEWTDRAGADLWVGGRGSSVRLGSDGGEVGATGAPSVGRGDHPDTRDVSTGTGTGWAIVRGTEGGARVLVRRPDGVEVQGDDHAWGEVLPVWADLGAVLADGRVAATVADGVLTLWDVARGARLWMAPVSAPRGVRLGPDYVALADGPDWRFLDPADGHLLARIPPGGVVYDGAGAPLGWLGRVSSAALRGASWSAAAPAGRDRRDDPTAAWVRAAPEASHCPFLELYLAGLPLGVLEPWVALARERCPPWPGDVARSAVAPRPVPTGLTAGPPGFDDVPATGRDAGWAWRAPTVLNGLVAVPGKGVVVSGGGWVYGLDPGGALRWMRRGGGTTVTARSTGGGTVLVTRPGAVERWDGGTGRVLWTTAMAEQGGWGHGGGWIRRVVDGAWTWLDAATGRMRPAPASAPPSPARAEPWGPTPHPDLAIPPEAAAGSVRYRIDGRWILAWGAGPPGPAAPEVDGPAPLAIGLPELPAPRRVSRPAPPAQPWSGTARAVDGVLTVWGERSTMGVDVVTGARRWVASGGLLDAAGGVDAWNAGVHGAVRFEVDGIRGEVGPTGPDRGPLVVTTPEGAVWRQRVPGPVWGVATDAGPLVVATFREVVVAWDARTGWPRWAAGFDDVAIAVGSVEPPDGG